MPLTGAPSTAVRAEGGQALGQGGMRDREIEADRLLTMTCGIVAGRAPRGIAMNVWGEENVAGEWGSDSWMRLQVRRRTPKAQALADGS